MTPRPANPPPDRRQEILAAALELFAQKGYTAATNAEIARAAGITAAALYYYFPSKADLFRAAITERRGHILPNVQQMAGQLREHPPEMVLPLLIRAVLTFLSEEPTRALVRIVLSEGPRNPEIVAIWQEIALAPMMEILFGYLQHQMDLGTIRQMDPRIFAMIMQGPALSLLLMRDVLAVPPLQDIDNETFLEHATQALLNGLLANPKE